MTVMWMTKHPGCQSYVVYAKDSDVDWRDLDAYIDSFTLSQLGGVTSLQPSDMCAQPASDQDYGATWHHSVTLNNLAPATWYWYCPEASRHCFKLRSPLPAGAEGSWNFVMYGDMGVDGFKHLKAPGAHGMAQAVRQEVLGNDARLVLHVGDISYADGRGAVWDDFMHEICTFSAAVPYMVSVGNHDYDYKGDSHLDPSDTPPYHPKWGHMKGDSGGECGVALVKRFVMPADPRGNGDNSPFWYSYNYGSVHFVTVSSEHDLSRHSEQWSWLVSDLAAVDRCTSPWVVLSIHRPLYVIKPHHVNRKVARHLRRHLEAVLVKYGVDVVVSGHVHSFSRSCPTVGGECVAAADGGVLHVIAGSGGHKLSKIKRRQPAWLDAAEREYGYMRVEIDDREGGDSTMRLSFVSARDGDVHDTVTLDNSLRRQRRCRFCYSRSGGRTPAGALGACSPSSDVSDLDQLMVAWPEGDSGASADGKDDEDGDRGEYDEDGEADGEHEGGEEGARGALPRHVFAAAAHEMDEQSEEAEAVLNADQMREDGDYVHRYHRPVGATVARGAQLRAPLVIKRGVYLQ